MPSLGVSRASQKAAEDSIMGHIQADEEPGQDLGGGQETGAAPEAKEPMSQVSNLTGSGTRTMLVL